MTGRLPELIDCKGIQKELRVTRASADSIMRWLPVVQIPGLRKTYVKRSDLARLIADCTSEGQWVFRKERVPV